MTDAEKLAKEALELQANKEYEQAFLFILKAIELEPLNTEFLLIRGGIYYRMLDYSAALEDAKRVLELEPDTDAAYTLQTFVYQAMKEYDKAIKSVSHRLSADQGHRIHRAHLYNLKGDMMNAIADYTFMIGWKPHESQHYFKRGKIYLSLKQFEDAKQDFQQVIAALPANHPIAMASRDYLTEIQSNQDQ